MRLREASVKVERVGEFKRERNQLVKKRVKE